jgi:hypothetical protein
VPGPGGAKLTADQVRAELPWHQLVVLPEPESAAAEAATALATAAQSSRRKRRPPDRAYRAPSNGYVIRVILLRCDRLSIWPVPGQGGLAAARPADQAELGPARHREVEAGEQLLPAAAELGGKRQATIGSLHMMRRSWAPILEIMR